MSIDNSIAISATIRYGPRKFIEKLISLAPPWLLKFKKERPILFWFILLNMSPLVPWIAIIPYFTNKYWVTLEPYAMTVVDYFNMI